ncbi:MAG: hypothetical protein IJT97_02000 [Bacteroidaceae bacterium]|nr:hypothetical protein [Bacteroidaceae bacterium]
MKKHLIHFSMIAVCMMLPATMMAQQEKNTENPRGVYKLIHVIGRGGDTFKEPFDQYKICTDSVTLMLVVSGNRYSLSKNDSRTFNYTGEEPDAKDSTATRIYNSNQEHFTLKWWSKSGSGAIFPDNDWCTEYYESGKYSEPGKIIFDALLSPPQSDKSNPFIGTWRAVGMMDEMRDMKNEMQRVHEEYEKRNPLNRGYHIITPSYFINTTASRGFVHTITYNNKKSLTIGPTTYKLTWLSKDRVAIEIHADFHTDYEIWERMTEETPLMNIFTGLYQ